MTEFFHPHIGGCEKRFFEIGRRLVARGHEVHVFTIQYNCNLPKEEQIEGMKVHRYAHSQTYISDDSFRSFGGILKYSSETFVRLLGSDFDLYYSNQWPMLHSLFVKPIATPFIQEWCEVWDRPLKVKVMQQLLKNVGDYRVAVSEFTRQKLLNLLKTNHKEIVVVPNGVDASRFAGANKKVWGRIIYVGRIVPHKHVEILVDAFREVKKKVPEAELHIVGSGLCFDDVKNRAADIPDCFIHGPLVEQDLVDLVKSAWLFVLPSEREGSGIAALEAMAAGAPFVTLDYPDNAAKELCKLKCGLVVEPRESALASAIIQLHDDDKLWKELSVNALKVARMYDWDMITNQIENLFTTVADNYGK